MPRARLLAALFACALFAGCTGDEDDGDGTPSPGATTPAPTTPASSPGLVASLQFREHATLGPILADGAGRTLYLFTNDERDESRCFGQCAVNWPPAMAASVPDAPASVEGNLSLVDREGGGRQLAYEGWPLYYWAGDDAPGEATGDTVGGNWFVVREPVDEGDVWAEGDVEATGENVTYGNGTTGYYAHPTGSVAGDATGVVMVHEWWGLNDNIRRMADTLASHGYHVLAVDLFGQVATTQEQALAQVQALDQQEATANMQAAADFLRSRGADGVQSLGWCFGGGQSLQLALSGEDLLATVVYYGSPVTDEARLATIDWPLLGIFGEDDQAIPLAQAKAFDSALGNASVERQVLYYPDVGHAFANPSGDAWAPIQTHDAWLRTLHFLDENRA